MDTIEIQPELNLGDVFQFLGTKGRSKPRSYALKNKVRIWIQRAKDLLTPRLLYDVYKIDHISKGGVALEDDCRLKSPKLSKTLRPCEEVVCFVATIGSRIEQEIKKLFQQNRLSDAYVLDAVGSAAVESLADQFQETIEDAVNEQDKRVTLRFSPGYCDWPVNQQKELFKLIDSAPTDVTLNDACLMTPRKSISGVFGIYREGEDCKTPYTPCSDCPKVDCPERREI
jgi:hypothetical protein